MTSQVCDVTILSANREKKRQKGRNTKNNFIWHITFASFQDEIQYGVARTDLQICVNKDSRTTIHRDERFHPEHVRQKKRFFYRKSIRKTLESPRAIIYYEIYVKLSKLSCIQNNAHWMDASIYLEKFFSISINFWSFSNRKWRHFRETQFFKNTQNQISWYSTSFRPSRKNRIWFLIFRPISWHNWADYPPYWPFME